MEIYEEDRIKDSILHQILVENVYDLKKILTRTLKAFSNCKTFKFNVKNKICRIINTIRKITNNT